MMSIAAIICSRSSVALRQSSLRLTPSLYRLNTHFGTSPLSASSETQANDYFEKNKRLNRPLSPFMIYKLQLTSVLSFSHRMTGLSLAVLLYGGGISSFWSSSTNFEHVLMSIQSTVPHSILFTLKFLTCTSLVYHAVNGIRHLAWDLGYGFGLKELYNSGFVVIGITLIAAIGFLLKL